MKLTEFRFFWTFIKSYKGLLFAGLISVVAVALCILQIGQSLRVLIQPSHVSGFLPSLWGLAFWVCGLAIASFGRSYSFACLAEEVVNDLKQAIFSNLMRLEMNFYDQQGIGEILSRFHRDTETIHHFFAGTLGTAIRNLLMLIGGVVFLLQTSLYLTLVSLAMLPLIFIPVFVLLRFYKRQSQKTQEIQGQESQYVVESVQNIRLVQAFNYGSIALARWTALLAIAEHSAQQRYWLRAWLSSTIIMLVSLSIAGILTAGVYSVYAGYMMPGELASFLFYAVIVAATGSSLAEIAAEWQRVLVSQERLDPFLRAIPQRFPIYQRLPSPLQGIIAVHHINFAYPNASQAALNDITFSAATGEMVAIVGSSGAGKSTLLSLLLGFYYPQVGQIFLDGVDQAKVDPLAWRECFGYVSQEPFIFSDTLYNNILMGNPRASEQEVKRAVEAASLGEFVAGLPQGLATNLGNKGIMLSTGQKQRLAIARVILRNPRVLLLDEATNALDALSEQQVQESLNELMATRTTLVVAHRLRTVLRANRIIVLHQGCVEAVGTHAELIAQQGLYQRLATLEFVDIPKQYETTPRVRGSVLKQGML